MKKIQKEHIALIIKYTGISFITWGISHGFFSWDRQIITSLVGICFFIAWTLLEQKSENKTYMHTILFSAILAISIWAVTWWLQHFPDSPDRSLWIVPLWFIVSVYAYFSLEKETIIKKAHLLYAFVGFILFITISLTLYSLVGKWYLWADWHDHWEAHHNTVENIEISENSRGAEIWEESEVHFKWDGHDHDH